MHQRATRRLRTVAVTATVAALLLACLSLIGHLFGVSGLYTLRPRFAALSAVTTIAIALLATARLASFRGAIPAVAPSASAALALGVAALASYLATGQDRLNPLLAHWLGADPTAIGRTSAATSIAIILLAAASLPAIRRNPRTADTLAGLALLIAFLALSAYAYGTADLYAMSLFRTMSPQAAASIFLLATAEILQNQQAGWAAIVVARGRAGTIIRRQLLCLLIPPAVGWALVEAAAAGRIRLGAAVASLVALTVAPLFWLIMREGHILMALQDTRRQKRAAEAAHLETLERKLDAQATQLHQQTQDRLDVAEAAALRSEERYRLLFNSIDAGFCLLEIRRAPDATPTDYRFLEINAAFEAQTGLVAEGRWMRDLAPDHEQHWFDIYGTVAATGLPARFENAATALGRWYDVHAFPITGSPDHVGVLFNDISQRRAAELALQDINATLEQRIDAALSERELAHAALRQSQKMEAMGQLTGGVAHDFNNLLTPIIGTLDLLTRRAVGGEREQRLIGAAMQAADRARTLIQRLLAFARRQPLQIGPIDVASLVRGMADLVASTSGPQVRVQVDIAEPLPCALADVNQLEMAILNLAVNARDAMPDGGSLTITLREAPPTDCRTPLRPGRYIQLSVSDTGTGMDAATLQRAVEPFFSTKGIGKGTGLGLSMVHGLAAQLNGALDIHSRPAIGTRIDLWLPASAAPADTPQTPPQPSPDATARGRILVVDDESLVRMTTSDMLQDLGYRTVEAESARHAMTALLDGETVDLVITDHLMPGMTGAEFARAIRHRWPTLPVLLVSGYADAEGVASDLPRLAKPFRHTELAEAIRSITGPSKTLRQA